MYDGFEQHAPPLDATTVDAREKALEITAAAREALASCEKRVRSYIASDPVRALGIALGLGVFVGWLIKRR